MTIKTTYVADDGTIFETESACLQYESRKRTKLAQEVEFVNKFCKFFDNDGEQLGIDEKFNENKIYAVTIDCAPGDVGTIMNIFGDHFNDLYYALEASDFQNDYKVTLVYDWTDDGRGWKEIDYEQKTYLEFMRKIMERA
jgi:hypothetical protein